MVAPTVAPAERHKRNPVICGMDMLWTYASRIAHPVQPHEPSRFAELPLWQELRHRAAILAFSSSAHPWAHRNPVTRHETRPQTSPRVSERTRVLGGACPDFTSGGQVSEIALGLQSENGNAPSAQDTINNHWKRQNGGKRGIAGSPIPTLPSRFFDRNRKYRMGRTRINLIPVLGPESSIEL